MHLFIIQRETINIQNAFALKNKENVVHLENTIKVYVIIINKVY